MNSDAALVKELLGRQVKLAIINGQLKVEGKANNPEQSDWIKENQAQVIKGILELTCRDGFTYESYSTGNYQVTDTIKAPGLTIQLTSLITGEILHKVFNVSLTRSRSSKHGKKGSPLPNNRFIVTRRHNFYKFWLSTSLTVRKLSEFHDYMGNLKKLVFDCEYRDDGRASKITPMNITHDEICKSRQPLPHSTQLSARQYSDKSQTISRQECQTRHRPQPTPLEAYSDSKVRDKISTVKDKSKQGGTYISVGSSPSKHPKEPIDQTNNEWLIDLGPMP